MERRRKKNSNPVSRARNIFVSRGQCPVRRHPVEHLLVLTFIIPIFLNAFFLIPATKENSRLFRK